MLGSIYLMDNGIGEKIMSFRGVVTGVSRPCDDWTHGRWEPDGRGKGFSSSCTSFRHDDADGPPRSSTTQCDISYGSEAEYIAEMVKQSFHRYVVILLLPFMATTGWIKTCRNTTRMTQVYGTRICRKPKETASAILDSITEIDRIHLLLAMQSKASKANIEVRDREYIDDLVKSIRKAEAHQHLSRGEIANALAYQQMLQRYSSHSNQPPSWKQLSGVMLAAGLPFVGYVRAWLAVSMILPFAFICFHCIILYTRYNIRQSICASISDHL